MSFGETLKKLRNNKGITQEKLAFDLGIPESTIRRLETSDGFPRNERLQKIAQYFNVTTDYLLLRATRLSDVKNVLKNEPEELVSILLMFPDITADRLIRHVCDVLKNFIKDNPQIIETSYETFSDLGYSEEESSFLTNGLKNSSLYVHPVSKTFEDNFFVYKAIYLLVKQSNLLNQLEIRKLINDTISLMYYKRDVVKRIEESKLTLEDVSRLEKKLESFDSKKFTEENEEFLNPFIERTDKLPEDEKELVANMIELILKKYGL